LPSATVKNVLWAFCIKYGHFSELRTSQTPTRWLMGASRNSKRNRSQ